MHWRASQPWEEFLKLQFCDYKIGFCGDWFEYILEN